MRKHHIVQVSAYFPPHLGGQENAVESLARSLALAGHDVDVLTSTRGGGPKKTDTKQGVHVRRLGSIVFGHAPIMPGFLPALWRRVRPGSIVHLHIGQAFTPEMVYLTSRLRGIPYIAQLHIDFEPSGPAGILLPLYKRFVLKPVLHGASAVVVLNKKMADIVRSKYNYKAPLFVMNNGIDNEFFELARKPVKKLPAIPQLLFVGRLSKQKNIEVLLQALTLAKQKVRLDIIGDGTEAEEIRKAIKKYNLTRVVTMHGRLSRRDVMAFYKTSDVLIMPSLYEAQPLVLLEAMAARIPIIGTNVIGVAEHIKDIGIIAEPTAAGLADAIDEFCTRYHTMPSKITHGFEKAQALSWPNLLKEYEQLYESVLGN